MISENSSQRKESFTLATSTESSTIAATVKVRSRFFLGLVANLQGTHLLVLEQQQQHQKQVIVHAHSAFAELR